MIPILISLTIFASFGLGKINHTSDGIEICKFYEEAETKFKCGKNGLLQKMSIKYCNLSFDPGKILKMLLNKLTRF